MLNVLFVLYHDFTSNSAVHVFHWANELSAHGVSCIVAVPDSPQTVSGLGKARFGVCSFDDLSTGTTFANGRGPDIVHAWTPRENVRRVCQRLRERYEFRQFIHLEDNEEHLLACMSNRTPRAISTMSSAELDSLVPPTLSHPARSREFLASADGVTVIIDRLRDFVPDHVPTLELWPAADGGSFIPGPIDQNTRSRLRIPADNIVLVYTGNVHPANAREVRSVYLAVAILNRERHPATLVRTGRDFCQFLGPDEAWGRANAVELGYVSRQELPRLLSAASVLVQPGRPGPFNDYRFPSKIPEFLAAGRPLILPACNVGLHMVSGEDACVLPKVDALGIVDAVLGIMEDRRFCELLSLGARAFFNEHMNWERSAKALLTFYEHSGAALAATRMDTTADLARFTASLSAEPLSAVHTRFNE